MATAPLSRSSSSSSSSSSSDGLAHLQQLQQSQTSIAPPSRGHSELNAANVAAKVSGAISSGAAAAAAAAPTSTGSGTGAAAAGTAAAVSSQAASGSRAGVAAGAPGAAGSIGGGGGSGSTTTAPRSGLIQKKGFKLVLLGDAAVGKSSILMRFLKNKFSEGIETTVGGAFSTKTIERGGRTLKLEIWDTAGQERFRSLAPMYFRGASAAIVVYDQTNEASFERAEAWVKQVMQTGTNPNIIIALAANKCDLKEKVKVSLEKAEELAAREGLLLLETSALTGKNVLQLFEKIADHLPEEPFAAEHGTRSLQVPLASSSSAPASTQGAAPARSGCCMGG